MTRLTWQKDGTKIVMPLSEKEARLMELYLDLQECKSALRYYKDRYPDDDRAKKVLKKQKADFDWLMNHSTSREAPSAKTTDQEN